MDTEELKLELRKTETSIRLEHTFTHGTVAVVYVGKRKASPPIVPNRTEGQTLGDVLKILGDLAEQED